MREKLRDGSRVNRHQKLTLHTWGVTTELRTFEETAHFA